MYIQVENHTYVVLQLWNKARWEPSLLVLHPLRTNSHRFALPGCRRLKRTPAAHRSAWTETLQEVITDTVSTTRVTVLTWEVWTKHVDRDLWTRGKSWTGRSGLNLYCMLTITAYKPPREHLSPYNYSFFFLYSSYAIPSDHANGEVQLKWVAVVPPAPNALISAIIAA